MRKCGDNSKLMDKGINIANCKSLLSYNLISNYLKMSVLDELLVKHGSNNVQPNTTLWHKFDRCRLNGCINQDERNDLHLTSNEANNSRKFTFLLITRLGHPFKQSTYVVIFYLLNHLAKSFGRKKSAVHKQSFPGRKSAYYCPEIPVSE